MYRARWCMMVYQNFSTRRTEISFTRRDFKNRLLTICNLLHHKLAHTWFPTWWLKEYERFVARYIRVYKRCAIFSGFLFSPNKKWPSHGGISIKLRNQWCNHIIKCRLLIDRLYNIVGHEYVYNTWRSIYYII